MPRSLWLSVLVNVLIFTLTLVGLLIGNAQDVPKDTLVSMSWSVWAVCAAATVILFSWQVAIELREKVLELRRTHSFIQSLPAVIQIDSRTDEYVLKSNGDCQYKCTLEIRKKPGNEHYPDLYFPLYLEQSADAQRNDQSAQPERVKVESIKVNGTKLSGKPYQRIEIRSPFNPGDNTRHPLEYGTLKIPVGLGPEKTECLVELNMVLEKTFPKLETREFVLVEIPYVTSKIDVRVLLDPSDYKDKKRVIRPVDESGGCLVANMGVANNRDLTETANQNHKVIAKGEGLFWETHFPKLGHRYYLYFQVCPKA